MSIVCVVASLAAADTKTVTVQPGINQLTVAASDGADVSWESRQPLTLRFITNQLASGESAIAFCAVSGTDYVIVSDVIDWDAKRREKTTWIVSVDGDAPDPGPGPDPEPNPPTPEPDNVPNRYGIGPKVSQTMRQLSNRSDLAKVVKLLLDHEKELNENRMTGGAAMKNIHDKLGSLSGWSGVRDAMTEAFNAAGQQHGYGINDAKNFIREARLTIELYKDK